MTPKEARALIETAFKAEWGTDIPVDYNNDMAAVPKTPFVRLFIQNAGPSSADSMTGDLIRYSRFGIAFVQVFTALGIGPALADDLARRATLILEGRDFNAHTTDVLSLGSASQTTVGTNQSGDWQVNVSVPFSYAEYRMRRYV